VVKIFDVCLSFKKTFWIDWKSTPFS
jgi:hypothetical protein